jgi:hypothetical protein
MNRRFFTFGLGALLGVPKVPMASITTGAPVAAAHLKLATMLSRAHDSCSPEFLMRHLKVDKAVATQVQRALIQTKVITAPSASGVSYAVNPMHLSRLSNSFPAQPSGLVQQVKDKIMDELTSREGGEPDDRKAKTDDGIPTSHGHTDEIPRDLVATHDGRGQDLG